MSGLVRTGLTPVLYAGARKEVFRPAPDAPGAAGRGVKKYRRLPENALPKMCVTGLWGNRPDLGSVASYVPQIRVGFTRKVGACRLGELVFGQAPGGQV